MSKAYILTGDQYARFDVDAGAADPGYPQSIADGWSNLPDGYTSAIDAVLDIGNGMAYFFKGTDYIRVNQGSNTLDGGPNAIADYWSGLADVGFADSVDAAANWGNGSAYFFKGDSVVTYDIAADAAVAGSVATISSVFAGLADDDFATDLDAVVNWGNGTAYFFKGDSYISYDIPTGAVVAGSKALIADGFGVTGEVDAIWIKLTADQPAPVPNPLPTPVDTPVAGASLTAGDHIWYWSGKVSRALDIPRSDWFPGSNPNDPNDYLGNGKDIYNFVVHQGGEIRSGQPQLLSGKGSYAWLNNNPGNLTGNAAGTYGEYPGKHNWHNFLIFPTADIGFKAIAPFLLGNGYSNLSITDALKRYAPQGDGGNDPVAYGNKVAAAIGVPSSTLVGALTDDQLAAMSTEIEKVEGTVPGTVLSKDSPDLPPEVAAALS